MVLKVELSLEIRFVKVATLEEASPENVEIPDALMVLKVELPLDDTFVNNAI